MRRRASRAAFLAGIAYAHRGLHGSGLSENGLPACAAALDAGHGVECDIRLSADGMPMIFHDTRLMRMTGVQGRLRALPAARLATLRLPDGGPVPRLADLLALAKGRGPLLLELKCDSPLEAAPLARAVAMTLARYDGPVAVMSFEPLAARWFARHAPGVVRGLVMSESWRPRPRPALDMRRARPDFLAYDVRDLPAPLPALARANGLPVLSWTVRSPAQRAIVARHADAPIFEGAGLG